MYFDRPYALTPALSRSKSDISDFDNNDAHLGFTRDGWEREPTVFAAAEKLL